MTAMIMTARHLSAYNARQFATFRERTLPCLAELLEQHRAVNPVPGQLWERVAEQKASGSFENVAARLRDRPSPDWELHPVRWHDPDNGDMLDDHASGNIRSRVRIR